MRVWLAALLLLLLIPPAVAATEPPAADPPGSAGSDGSSDSASVDPATDVTPTADPRDPNAKRERSADPLPRIGLDRLLAPRHTVTPTPRDAASERGRRAWREDYVALEQEIATLESRIDGAQLRFREVAGHEWGYTPPGAGAPTDPEVLRIRAGLKRDRQSLEAARRRLRDLEIEASLAGVPRGWLEDD